MSSARQPGDPVEGEVRPEAVRVRQQRALRLPGRARGVDEQEAVVVLGRPRATLQQTVARLSSGAVRGWRLGAELGELVGAEEDGRLGVLELVAELRRGEAGVQRHQDQPRLRAGEEDDDVLGARRRSASRRGRPARARPRAGRPRAGRSARRAPRTSSRRRGSRSRRAPASSARGRGSSVPASARSERNSVTTSTKRSGCSQKKRWPQPGNGQGAIDGMAAKVAGRLYAGCRASAARGPRRFSLGS